MPTYKNIRIPKRGGGTRLQRVQVLASGKYKFVKNPTRSTRKKNNPSKKKSVRKKGGSRMVRRMTIPIAAVVPLAASLVDPIKSLISGDVMQAVDHISARFAGYSPQRKALDLGALKEGLVPLIIGLLVHKFVGGTLGVNRMLGRARVPLLRL